MKKIVSEPHHVDVKYYYQLAQLVCKHYNELSSVFSKMFYQLDEEFKEFIIKKLNSAVYELDKCYFEIDKSPELEFDLDTQFLIIEFKIERFFVLWNRLNLAYDFEKKLYSDLLDRLDRLEQKHPKNALIHYYLSGLAYSKSEFEKAYNHIEKSIEFGANTFNIIELRISILKRLKKDKEVVEYIDTLLPSATYSSDEICKLLFSRANSKFEIKDVFGAFCDFTNEIELSLQSILSIDKVDTYFWEQFIFNHATVVKPSDRDEMINFLSNGQHKDLYEYYLNIVKQRNASAKEAKSDKDSSDDWRDDSDICPACNEPNPCFCNYYVHKF